MHHASETQSPVGEAFYAAVHDVEMLEVSPLSSETLSSVPHYTAEQPSAVPSRSSSRVPAQRSSIASVVAASDLALLSTLTEASRLMTSSALPVPATARQRLNVREKLYADHAAPAVPDARDRSPVRPHLRTTPPATGMLVQSHAAVPASSPSVMLGVPSGVHAVTVMPSSVERVGVQVHWGEDVCDGSSPPPKRLSGSSFRDGTSAVEAEPQSSEDDYGESSLRAAIYGAENEIL